MFNNSNLGCAGNWFRSTSQCLQNFMKTYSRTLPPHNRASERNLQNLNPRMIIISNKWCDTAVHIVITTYKPCKEISNFQIESTCCILHPKLSNVVKLHPRNDAKSIYLSPESLSYRDDLLAAFRKPRNAIAKLFSLTPDLLRAIVKPYIGSIKFTTHLTIPKIHHASQAFCDANIGYCPRNSKHRNATSNFACSKSLIKHHQQRPNRSEWSLLSVDNGSCL